MKRLLMIAYHFPPLAGSSGIQRTLRFARYLPENGWEPIILTAHPRAYERTSQDQLPDVADDLKVVRAQAWDTARHFSFAGRYVGAMARPDRWLSWKFDAIRRGRKLIRQYQPDAIWSTYPIATAHLIGEALHRHSGLPWLADFRDPMAQDGYPADPITWQQFKHIEERAAREASALIFTTPGACDEYRSRYPVAADRIQLIENGFDEEPFSGIDVPPPQGNKQHVTLLHSGIIYPSERDPRPLFDALAAMKTNHPQVASRLKIRLRACAHEDFVNQEVSRRGIADMVETCPPIPYREALQEMCHADGLLVMQASNCNQQIPAKLYEYLRAGRPVIGLTDPGGDTAKTLLDSGIRAVTPLDDPQGIHDTLLHFLDHEADERYLPIPDYVKRCSRQSRTIELARLLERL